jgi:hypothetical protein
LEWRFDGLHPAASAVFLVASSVRRQVLVIAIALFIPSFSFLGSTADLLILSIVITVTIAVVVVTITVIVITIAVIVVTVVVVVIIGCVTLVAGVVDTDQNDTVVDPVTASKLLRGFHVEDTGIVPLEAFATSFDCNGQRSLRESVLHVSYSTGITPLFGL